MGDNKVICVGKETEMVWSCAEETRGSSKQNNTTDKSIS